MRFEGFIGPSYTSQTRLADVQRTVNLYPEIIESQAGRASKFALYGTPGRKRLVTLPDAPGRATFQQDGRTFVLAGLTLFELTLTAPYYITRGTIGGVGGPASICSNGTGGHQLFIVAGGNGYIFDLNANTLTQISSVTTSFPAQATMGQFLDGYFIVLESNSNQFQLSSLEDGTKWSGLDVGQRESGSDNIVAIAVDHRELWLFGSLTTEVWYDSGNASFPFQPIPGAFMEIGAIPWTVVKFDNSLAFVGINRAGGAVAYRAANFTPARISTHAVEYQWSTYSTVADAEAFTYQEQGHSFYVINFPTAQATWVFDAATQEWHERDWWNSATGLYERIRDRFHAYEWGMHLTCDRSTGDVWQVGLGFYDDVDTAIHRRRRSPHIAEELLWSFHSKFQLDCEVGIGITGQPTRNPLATLRWSNDGGWTWSRDYTVSMGLVGNYQTRTIWRRLGRARDRVYEVEVSDALPVRMVGAYLDVVKGTS